MGKNKLIDEIDMFISREEYLKLEKNSGTEVKKEWDNVNHPKHYQLDGLNCEVMDVIRSILGDEGFRKYCHGNIIKYILRSDKKNGDEDFKKARYYINEYLGENGTGDKN